MKTPYAAFFMVSLLGYALGANLRCKQSGGTSGSCDRIIRGYMFSTWSSKCFSMNLKGCQAVGKFFENKSDCLQCLQS